MCSTFAHKSFCTCVFLYGTYDSQTSSPEVPILASQSRAILLQQPRKLVWAGNYKFKQAFCMWCDLDIIKLSQVATTGNCTPGEICNVVVCSCDTFYRYRWNTNPHTSIWRKTDHFILDKNCWSFPIRHATWILHIVGVD